MKNIKILFFLSLIALAFQSCKDECDDVDCGPNGTCIEGTCACDEGYSGANCETFTEIREKFIGIYEGDLTPCLPSLLASQVPDDQQEILAMTQISVTKADGADLSLVNIASTSDVLGISLEASVTEPNFTVPDFNQEISVAGLTITVDGKGTGMFLEDSTIQLDLELTFSAFIGEFSSECTTIFTQI